MRQRYFDIFCKPYRNSKPGNNHWYGSSYERSIRHSFWPECCRSGYSSPLYNLIHKQLHQLFVPLVGVSLKCIQLSKIHLKQQRKFLQFIYRSYIGVGLMQEYDEVSVSLFLYWTASKLLTEMKTLLYLVKGSRLPIVLQWQRYSEKLVPKDSKKLKVNW